MGRWLVLVWLAALPFAAAATADARSDAALAASQAVVGREVPDLPMLDTDARPVSLGAFRGRPVVLTLIYTGCADVCPLVIENLAPAAAAAEQALGAGSFTVITIGFDARNDTPARMRSFAREHRAGGKNWHFLAARDAKTRDLLADAVGFNFFPSAGGFDHMAQVTVIDKHGKIYRQIYGSTFDTPQIVEPLKELIFGREKPFFSLEGISARVKLFCTVYDPNTGRYYFNYSLFASIVIGAACLMLVLIALVKETRKAMKSRQA
jgi:protein SCO1/2